MHLTRTIVTPVSMVIASPHSATNITAYALKYRKRLPPVASTFAGPFFGTLRAFIDTSQTGQADLSASPAGASMHRVRSRQAFYLCHESAHVALEHRRLNGFAGRRLRS